VPADLFCWGIFRKRERGDQEWFDVYAKKVLLDDQYLQKRERALGVIGSWAWPTDGREHPERPRGLTALSVASIGRPKAKSKRYGSPAVYWQ
jgi:hypothetical protein